MRIGTTSFAFRYLMLDSATAPALEELLERCSALRLEVLQICENARPMTLPPDRWKQLVARGEQLGVEVQLGCKTLSPDIVAAHLERAAATRSRMLRVVLEDEGEHRAAPGAAELAAVLSGAWPSIRSSGVRLAIENHFDIPSQLLADAVLPYPAECIGFCIDTANSLRNFESPEQVLQLLGARAFCYHVKDFDVAGHMLGFTVGGATLGSGRLALDSMLSAILARDPNPDIFVENWTPSTSDRGSDIERDAHWLEASLGELRHRLAAR